MEELFQKQKQHVWTPPIQKLKAQLEKQLGKKRFSEKNEYCLSSNKVSHLIIVW